MFNLEKLFQKDDEIFVFFSFLSQSLIVFFALYLSTILSENTLLDLFNFGYFVNSQYFYFVTGVFVIFLSSFKIATFNLFLLFNSFSINDLELFHSIVPQG